MDASNSGAPPAQAMAEPDALRSPTFERLSTSRLGPFLLLIPCLLLTVALWAVESRDEQRIAHASFENIAERVAGTLYGSLNEQHALLDSAAAAVGVAAGADATRWTHYAARSLGESMTSGIRFMAFVTSMAGSEPPPPGARQNHTRILYLYPETAANLETRGIDLWSQPSHRAAMEHSRDYGSLSLADRISAGPEQKAPLPPGFTLYEPVYTTGVPSREPGEPAKNLIGFMVSAIDARDFMKSPPFGRENDALLELYAGDPAEGALLYSNRGEHQPHFSRDMQVGIGDKHLTLRVLSSPAFERRWLPSDQRHVLYVGGAISLLLCSAAMLAIYFQRRLVTLHQDLKEQHDAFSALVNSVPGTVFRARATPPWTVEYISEAITELTGKPPAHWLSNKESLLGSIHPEDLSRVILIVEWATSRGMPFEVEYRISDAGGKMRWARSRARIRKTPEGVPLWMDGVITDVSHEHALMQSLTEQRETLASTVEERTRELLQAKNAAEAANIAKSAMLRSVSHEFRTPLNAVLGFATLLLDTESTERRRRQLQEIVTAGRRVLEMVNRLLDFASLDSDRLTLHKREFRLDDLLETMADSVQESLSDKALELIVDRSPDLPDTLVGDPDRIGQVLSNLVLNAIKFTPRGEVIVELRQQSPDSRNNFLAVTVRDTGIGISREDQTRLFRAFDQIDYATTRRGEGMGLGLAISKRLVELMGGQIGVETTLGAGSAFWFTLALEAGTTPAENEKPQTSPLHGATALVSIHSLHAAQTLERDLAAMGLRVLQAIDGKAAVGLFRAAAAQGSAPALLLLDASSATSDARETARAVRAIEASPPPCIALLVNGPCAVPQEVDAVVLKPLLPSRLRRALNAMMSLPDHRPSTGSAGSTAAVFDPRELHEACTELRQMLAQGEFKVASVFEARAPLLRKAIPDAYPHIERSISGFDFSTALSALESGMHAAGLEV